MPSATLLALLNELGEDCEGEEYLLEAAEKLGCLENRPAATE